MLGLMMDVPLLTTGILHYAAVAHGETLVVSRCIDGSIYRYSYSEAHARCRRVSSALVAGRCHLRKDVADDGKRQNPQGGAARRYRGRRLWTPCVAGGFDRWHGKLSIVAIGLQKKSGRNG